MRLALALGATKKQVRIINYLGIKNVLVAYPYAIARGYLNYSPEYFLADSGAFSAWSVGIEVDIEGYADWVTQLKTELPRVVAVNLDVIPGERGRTSTKAEREQGMMDSLENADYLRGRGIDVMEVFHQDEPAWFLDALLDRLPEHGILGLSPRNDVALNSKLEWQTKVLASLRKRYAVKDLPRTHGLAVTSFELLKGFPYYSADSSSWSSAGRFGSYSDEYGKMKMTKDLFAGRSVAYSESSSTVEHMIVESIQNILRIEEAITSLWERRGVKWED